MSGLVSGSIPLSSSTTESPRTPAYPVTARLVLSSRAGV